MRLVSLNVTTMDSVTHGLTELKVGSITECSSTIVRIIK